MPKPPSPFNEPSHELSHDKPTLTHISNNSSQSHSLPPCDQALLSPQDANQHSQPPLSKTNSLENSTRWLPPKTRSRT
ncbi:hypothetical protein Tco_0301826, partial [Tanacetum coccineum]